MLPTCQIAVLRVPQSSGLRFGACRSVPRSFDRAPPSETPRALAETRAPLYRPPLRLRHRGSRPRASRGRRRLRDTTDGRGGAHAVPQRRTGPGLGARGSAKRVGLRRGLRRGGPVDAVAGARVRSPPHRIRRELVHPPDSGRGHRSTPPGASTHVRVPRRRPVLAHGRHGGHRPARWRRLLVSAHRTGLSSRFPARPAPARCTEPRDSSGLDRWHVQELDLMARGVAQVE